MKSRKAYESPTRKEHAELTRQKIVRALMDLMIEERPTTIAIPAVAKRANVSVRTVYHYFPTKDSLFDALPEASRQRGALEIADPTSPKELAGFARDAFAYFERNEALFNALRVSEAAAHVVPELDRRALARAAKAVSPLAEQLDADSLEKIQGLVGLLMSYDAYRALTRRYQLSKEDAADAIAWTITTIADRAKRTKKVGRNDD